MSKKISLIGFIFIIMLIIIKGSLSKFITPTLTLFVYISLPVIILFLISEFRKNDIFRRSRRKRKVSILFLIPIIFGIIGCNGTFSEAYTKNIAKTNYNNNLSISTTNKKYNTSTQETVNEDSNEETQNVSELKEEVKENGKVINVNDDNYIDTLNKVYEDIDGYLGTTINIEGCVFRDGGTMQENQFGAGKYYMYCCAIDMSLCGFLFQYDNYEEIKDNSWYKIEAVVDKHEVTDSYYGTYTEPLLQVKNITEISRPKETIVYQNY